MTRVLVYGDTSANIIDGSSIWLASITTVLSQVADEVHVLLKYPPAGEVLLGAMRELPGVTIHMPAEIPPPTGPEPHLVATQASDLVAQHHVDVVIVRGLEVALAFSDKETLASRLWSYVTDLPFPLSRLSVTGENRLNRLAARSRRMFSQTESSRSYLEAIAQMAAGKTILMPPMVPDEAFRPRPTFESTGPLRLIYSGKFAREWRVYEMLELPRHLNELGISANLTVVGAKFNKVEDSPGWPARMRARLEAMDADPESGVTWVGNLPRAESLELMRRADIGLGWRSEILDSSLEISTKVLEYGATGVAPVVNDTMDHRDYFGDDYPFFVRGEDSVKEVADKIAQGLPRIADARHRSLELSKKHAMSAQVDRLRSVFDATTISASSRVDEFDPPISSPKSLLIASHDLKFLGEPLDIINKDAELTVTYDNWSSLHNHDPRASELLLSDADTILCEWAGPNLVWYSHHVKPHQRLITRMHGFELRRGPWLHAINFDKVDAVIVVSNHYRDMLTTKLGVSGKKIHVIPNMIHTDDFARPKTRDAQYRLGLVGWVPMLKRPDRAVDLLSRLLEMDDRYTLHIRGRAPWEYSHYWNNMVERQAYLEFFQTVSKSHLRARVVFEGFGADMASWLRKIGFVLSTSDHESFHLAPVEGMASGAVPIVWERDGSADVFGHEHVHQTVEDAATRVLGLTDPDVWLRESRHVQSVARERWDSGKIGRLWQEIIHGPEGDTPPRNL